jgi:sugar lactone lactonase YvrE
MKTRYTRQLSLLFALFLFCTVLQAQLVETFAGTGSSGSADGTGTSASFNRPWGICVDASGNLFVSDYINHKIRKITPSGVVTTFAGSGTAGSTDGTGTAASFRNPAGLAIDAAGNILVADYYNHKIRKISPSGVVTTIAGTGSSGAIDGSSSLATFQNPGAVCSDANGNIFIVDVGNNKIRKINSSGIVSTFAGDGTSGSTDGNGNTARFYIPRGITIDVSGNLFVGDYGNNKIRKITPAGVVSTLAGSGTQGVSDGTGNAASFYNPSGLTVDQSGNIFVCDEVSNRIRKVTSQGVVTTIAGSPTGSLGGTDGVGSTARFRIPTEITIFNSNLFIADQSNHKIRKITPIPEIKISQGATELVSGLGSYNFGNVNALSSSSAVSFTIENVSPTERVLSLTGSPKVTLSGTNASEFSVNSSAAVSPVAVGSATYFTITFSPTSGGSKTATVTVLNDDVDEGTYTFTVTGTGIKINQSLSGLSNISAAYGDPSITLSASSSSGLTPSYVSSNTNVATFSGNVLTIVGAGTSTITASQSGNATYNAATNATATITVSKAFLTIIADDKTKVEGSANPPLTITYSGLVDSDDETMLGCIVNPQTTANTSSPAGSYPITVSNCGYTNTNYNYTFSGGTLTVTTATSNVEESESSLFYVSPNPSNGQLLLDAQEELLVEIFNASGRTVFEAEFPIGEHHISMELMEPGLYILRAIDPTGNVSEKRIIRN